MNNPQLGRRQLLGGVFAVLAAAGPAGCGGGEDSGGAAQKVGLVLANKLSYALQMAAGFSAGVARVGGIAHEVAGPDIVDGPKQLQMFQDLLTSARGGVSIFTLTPEVFARPLAKASADGIPLIAVDNPPPTGSGLKLYVGNDNHALGRMLAAAAIAKLPADAEGVIVIGTRSPGAPVLDRRAKGMRDEIRAKLPKVKILGPFDTKQEVGANLTAWRTLTTANKKALAFLGTGSADGWNLAEIRSASKATWVAGAFDLDPKSLTAAKAGDLLLVSPEHFVKGAVAGYLQALHAATGQALPEGWIYIPGLLVNADNIDAIIARQATSEATAATVSRQVDEILNNPAYLRSMSQAS